MNFFLNELTPKKYLSLFILCLLLSSVFYLPYLLFLKRVGEYKSIHDIAAKQLMSLKQNQKIIYGSGIRPMNYFYKKELMDNIHPDVVAWGSSRVMQFRQKMFLSRFVNLGGIMNSLDAGLLSYKDIIAIKPKIILLGIDFWWFNENFQNKNYKETIAPQFYKPKSSDFKMVKDWLKEGKLTYVDLLKGVFNPSSEGIGVAGILKDGFGPDGSYYYTSIITGNKKHHDPGFSDTLTRIRKGERRFQYGEKISDTHFKEFTFILEQFKRNDIEVILFFPPLAAASNQMMHRLSEKYAYIPRLKKALHDAGYRYHDYTDAGIIGSSDCEFIDGFHGGDVTYLRILKDLTEKEVSLAKYINKAFLNRNIVQYKGLSFMPDAQIVTANEIDFLELGCTKKG